MDSYDKTLDKAWLAFRMNTSPLWLNALVCHFKGYSFKVILNVNFLFYLIAALS